MGSIKPYSDCSRYQFSEHQKNTSLYQQWLQGLQEPIHEREHNLVRLPW